MLDDPAIPNNESKAGTSAFRRFALLPVELVDARVNFHLGIFLNITAAQAGREPGPGEKEFEVLPNPLRCVAYYVGERGEQYGILGVELADHRHGMIIYRLQPAVDDGVRRTQPLIGQRGSDLPYFFITFLIDHSIQIFKVQSNSRRDRGGDSGQGGSVPNCLKTVPRCQTQWGARSTLRGAHSDEPKFLIARSPVGSKSAPAQREV